MRQDEGFYIEYDDILCHNRIEFYGTYVGKSATQEDVADYLRYVFEEMLGWTPEDLRDKYTHELAEKLHISRLLVYSTRILIILKVLSLKRMV